LDVEIDLRKKNSERTCAQKASIVFPGGEKISSAENRTASGLFNKRLVDGETKGKGKNLFIIRNREAGWRHGLRNKGISKKRRHQLKGDKAT